jgi:caffeoyl-CoA O-methyltransferase
MKNIFAIFHPVILLILFGTVITASAQNTENPGAIETKAVEFLESHRNLWRDLNVPEYDGKLLHDIIVEHGYTRALEIGTSTGHSGIWIALALSKTGGKLITLEIDEDRHKTALGHFEEAGLSVYIDARLGDAHEIVPELEGPFDFVFSDADKGWYTNYFKAVAPKLEKGGCFTAHNVSGRAQRGIREFLEYVKNRPNFETTVDSKAGGVSISYKKP